MRDAARHFLMRYVLSLRLGDVSVSSLESEP